GDRLVEALEGVRRLQLDDAMRELRVVDDARERVVDLVRDARRELAERGEARVLPGGGLDELALAEVHEDAQDREARRRVARLGRVRDPDDLDAVRVDEAVLEHGAVARRAE